MNLYFQIISIMMLYGSSQYAWYIKSLASYCILANIIHGWDVIVIFDQDYI